MLGNTHITSTKDRYEVGKVTEGSPSKIIRYLGFAPHAGFVEEGLTETTGSRALLSFV